MSPSERVNFILAILLVWLAPLAGQETRSAIDGHVYDQAAAVVAGAKVLVTNLDTNTTVTLTTHPSGYYEAPLMLPGNYRISAAADGFKMAVRTGVVLSIGARLSIRSATDTSGQALI